MVRSTSALRALPIALFASLALLSGSAIGQERDPAAAQALFDQARDLIKQGHYAEACPKLQESNRLDPGIGTQFHLADCYEQSGRVASAWAAFLEVASQARASGQDDREKAATNRAEKLHARLPRLVVNVPEPSKTPGLEIRRNGMLVGSAQWGSPVAVDPGEVELTATAPGKQTLRQTLRLEEGKTASYNLPALAQGEGVAAPATETPPPAPPVEDAPKAAPTSEPPHEAVHATSHKNVGWVVALAGVGAVGFGISTTFAILAKSKANESKADCPDPNKPNSCGLPGVTARNNAIEKGNVATIAAVAGGAALAGAGLVWLLSATTEEQHADQRSTRLRAGADLGTHHGAFYLQGSF